MQEDKMMSPLFISPGDRLVVLFGGGKVALRKCIHFEGFRIRVVANHILPELRFIADETVMDKIDESSVYQNIGGAFIVVAATNDKELNGMIRDIATSSGILVNSAHGGGDVLIPSVLKRENYTVTVSTGGKAPAFPPYLVDMLDGILDDSYDLMMELMIEIRPMVMDNIPSQEERASFLSSILRDENIWDHLRHGDMDAAMESAKRMGGLR